jgi:hypothetical protein
MPRKTSDIIGFTAIYMVVTAICIIVGAALMKESTQDIAGSLLAVPVSSIIVFVYLLVRRAKTPGNASKRP